MRRKFLSVSLFLLVFLAASLAPTAYPQASDLTKLPTSLPVRVPEPVLLKDPQMPDYDLVYIPGTRYLPTPGHPLLPVKVISLKLPYSISVKSLKVRARYAILPGKYNIAPAPPALPLEGVSRFNWSKARPDPSIYGSDLPYPEESYRYSLRRGIEPYTLTPVSYLTIQLYPVKYLPSQGKLLYADYFDINIEYEESSVAEPLVATDLLVIITSSTLLPYAQDLASFKSSNGWTVEVETVENIDATYLGADLPERIRNFIMDKRLSEGAVFFLLFGDADQDLPPWKWERITAYS